MLRVFLMCCLTCCSPFLLPCFAAIQRLRWKPVSPEMAMCMLMVSRKRTREPCQEGGEVAPGVLEDKRAANLLSCEATLRMLVPGQSFASQHPSPESPELPMATSELVASSQDARAPPCKACPPQPIAQGTNARHGAGAAKRGEHNPGVLVPNSITNTTPKR